MSPYALFRRQAVPQQYAQQLRTTTFPAPTRGIVMNENESYMQPGGALIQDNWFSTMRGVRLRAGFTRWCDIHSILAPAWANDTAYVVSDVRYDAVDGTFWTCAKAHTSSAAPVTFAQDRAVDLTRWTATIMPRVPIISAFEYVSGSQNRMYAGQETELFDVTTSAPVLIKGGQHSGNYSSAQMSNASGNWLIAVNDFGDPPLRFNGTAWTTITGIADPGDGASGIGGMPAGGLTYVWKYRNRLFFIEALSMNAYFLDLNSVGGTLQVIPLSGAAKQGGYLLFGAVYSTDAGDGLDDKCVFVTNLGEVLVFTGTNPADPANWRQEGRWQISPPLGMNAHIQIGGDLIVLTVDGMVPLSQALVRDASQLELAMLTRTIKPLWREMVDQRREHPWTIKKWDEIGQMFVTWPGGDPGDRMAAASNLVTGAWCRLVGYDAMCFVRMRDDMFFCTQDGVVMQMERTGSDDGRPYLACLVGGWEMFGAPAANFVWHQARANFHSSAGEPFQPQLTATVDYVVNLPPPPSAGPDPGVAEIWDQGLWDHARWDQPSIAIQSPVRSTGWVSIGETGYAHAPIIQVTVAQQAPPDVELISVGAIYEPAGVNV